MSRQPDRIPWGYIDIDDVLAKVDKGTREECWEWTGDRNTAGYGVARYGGSHVMAHRIIYAWVHDDHQPPVVMHKCDNPPCCNPAHLYIGTQKDNMRDRDMRTGHPNAKLTETKVKKIRKLKGRLPVTEIARRFGVHRNCIGSVLNGRRWKWVP